MTAAKLTIAEAAAQARALGYTIRRTVDSEFVAYRKGEGQNSPAAYFSDDLADVLGTVQEMARRDALTAEAAALDPADAQREMTAAADKAGRLAESDPLAAALAYDRAAAMTRRTVALYAGHGRRERVAEQARAFDSRAFELRAAYAKAARNEARAENRKAGHECEDRADALTGEARARELDAAADHFDNVGGSHYPARARVCRKAAAEARRPADVIDLTPTWAGLAPALFAALTDGTPEGQDIARKELTRALAALDAHNAAAKAAQTRKTETARREISARLDRADAGHLRAFAFAILAHGQDSDEAAEDNLPGFDKPAAA